MAQTKVLVKSIQFKGNNALSTRELNLTVAQYIGKEMSYEDLLAVGVSIERYYNKQNRLARVILPPQDLSDGNLQLNVIESVVSKVEVEQALETMPKTQDYILAVLDARQKRGEALDSKAIERGLAVANEVPGVSVTGSLKEGELDGETELILKMYKNQSRQAEFLADNYGSRSTGAERAMASANFFNPRGIADLLNLTAIHTRGSEYARMAYSLPVGFDGWRMGANLSAMTYEVVKGAMGVVGATGRALVDGMEWSLPLSLTPEHNSKLALNVDHKDYVNVSAGVHHTFIHTPMEFQGGWESPYVKEIKEVSSKPVFLVGRITMPDVAEHLLAIEGLPLTKSGEGTAAVPASLLEDVFSLNEELDEIRELRERGTPASQLQARLAAAAAPIEARRQQHEQRMLALAERWDRRSGDDGERREVLEGRDIKDQVQEFLVETLSAYVAGATSEGYPEDWDLDRLSNALREIYPMTLNLAELAVEVEYDGQAIADAVLEDLQNQYAQRESTIGAEPMRAVAAAVAP